jgi:hypothetical protein
MKNVIEKAPETLVEKTLQWCPLLDKMPGPIIAGGFIRAYYTGTRPSDMDLFFREQKLFDISLALLKENYQLKVETERAWTFLTPEDRAVQIVKTWIGDPQEIINAFDFIMSMGALDWITKQVFYHENFLLDLMQRRLVYNKEAYCLGLSSLKRVVKFVSQGYRISEQDLAYLALRISGDNPAEIAAVAEGKVHANY